MSGPKPRPPRCKATVFGERVTSWPCSRAATRGGWCFQHHPDAEAKRRAKLDAEVKAEMLECDRRTAVDRAKTLSIQVAIDAQGGPAKVQAPEGGAAGIPIPAQRMVLALDDYGAHAGDTVDIHVNRVLVAVVEVTPKREVSDGP